MTNGAEALVRALVEAGVSVVFSNPGTSEMHFVAALESAPQLRAVLTLFEGVASGAADGYARMTGLPAATLLHLGPGLGNALANLHNARRAGVPLLNIVGDHATTHTQYDAQLQSDIETVARNVSSWVRTTASTDTLVADAAEAIAVARSTPQQVSTLILPADISWGSHGARPAPPAPIRPPQPPDTQTVTQIAAAMGAGGTTALLLGGSALHEEGLIAAAQISAATGAALLADVFPTRLQRGAGLPAVERLAYFPELATVQLSGIKHLVLAGARAPVSFFAYPDKPSYLVPDGCTVHALADPTQNPAACLHALVKALGATDAAPSLQPPHRPPPPRGRLTANTVCQAIGAVLPHNAIISDESQTSGVMLPAFTAGAPRHDVLTLTGGAIGQGLPVAIGAAVACPDRPVLAVQADGSAMYTIQSLWTMAREHLNITVVIINNRCYNILNVELQRVGASAAGPKARSQLDLSGPDLDFVDLGHGMGVPARRVNNAEDLTAAIQYAFSHRGPHLIEAVIPPAITGLKLKALPHALSALSRVPTPLAKALKRRFAP
ncbi:acetolactate synthase large subunit [Mycobacterium sp. pUA109]|uniref:acetolactate synthase large subunit n=1 Tax=Mycobacterium sp. pUA109 TaxID=3238982 RepID=UPI00351B3D6F